MLIVTNLNNTRESARQLRTEVANGVAQTNVQRALEEISTRPATVVETSIGIADSPYVPLATDTVLYVDTVGGAVTIDLRPASERISIALTIKDVTGHAAANPINIVPNGAETIETLTAYPINADFGGVRLNPQTGVGYVVDP